MVSETLDRIESQINDLQANLLGEHLRFKKCLELTDEMNIGESITKYKDEIRDISHLFIEADIHLECLDKSKRLNHEKRRDELENRFEIFLSILPPYDDN